MRSLKQSPAILFSSLVAKLSPKTVLLIAVALIAIGLAPGLIGSRHSEESSLAAMPVSRAAAPTVSDYEAELLQWAPPNTLAPPASISKSKMPQGFSPIAETEALDCIIEPYEVADVGSALSAVVHEVLVERSERVSIGQPLAQLDASVEIAALEVAGARARMSANIRARDARVTLVRQRADRAKRLYGEQIVSEDIKQEALAEAELAEAELAHARELNMLSRLERSQAAMMVERRTIRSPIDGVVVERLKDPGEVVNEETLFTIAQLDPLRVHAILPAANYGTIAKGMKAEVWPELPSIGVQVAQVEIVDPIIDAGSGTFGVQLRLPNSDYALPSGLRCRVRFLRIDESD